MLHRLQRAAHGAWLAAALCACTAEPSPTDSPRVVQKVIPHVLSRDIDLLFVVDNSASMQEEQTALRAHFPRLLEILGSPTHGLPNLHIGVVSSDLGTLGVETGDSVCQPVGDRGLLRNLGCPQVDGNFLRAIDADGDGVHEDLNATGSLHAAFQCMADLGTTGCGFEQHLEAMRTALSPDTLANAGFLRPEASLVVVFVADEDDCSAQAPAFFGPSDDALGFLDSFRCFEHGVRCDEDDFDERASGPRSGCVPDDDSAYLHPLRRYVDFLRGLKADPASVLVAGIVGDATKVDVSRRVLPGSNEVRPDLLPACYYPGPEGIQSADPAVRLTRFIDQFTSVGRSAATTVCATDPAAPLTQVGLAIDQHMGSRCFADTLRDREPDQAGLQPACAVSDVDGDTEQLLPLCTSDAANPPCWRVVVDPAECAAYPTQLALEIVRRTDPSPTTRTLAQCEIEPVSR